MFTTRHSPICLIAVSGFVAAASWLVVTNSLAAFLAHRSPQLALRLDPTNPVALIAAAGRAIDAERGAPALLKKVKDPAVAADAADAGAEPEGEAMAAEADNAETSRVVALQELAIEAAKTSKATATAPSASLAPAPLSVPLRESVSALARKVLRHDPLNARAMRLLGDMAAANGDAGKAEALMNASARHSLRESAAVAWLLDKSFERKDFAAATAYADILMRTRPQMRKPVTARLALTAETESGNAAVKALLATNPPWRASFFQMISPNITDARTPLDLLLSLKDTSNPPTIPDIKNYLDFLVGRKLYEVAYYAWLQFLDPEQLSAAGFVVNGGFEVAPSGMPFDWTVKAGTGVTVAVEQLAESPKEHALSVLFSQGRVNFLPVVQLTMLPPGEYTFTGRTKGHMNGRRGLLWRIACAEKPKARLGQSASALGKIPDWSALEFSFTIPAVGCGAQYLTLELDARSASEQLVSGSVWYDDIAIKRRRPASPGAG